MPFPVAPLGDSAVLITVGTAIDEPTNARVRSVTDRIATLRPEGFIEAVPAYASVAVHYDASTVRYDDFVDSLTRVLAADITAPARGSRTIEIPVVYGGEHGPDLDDVARATGLPPDEIVRRHAGAEYLVYMIGFLPGFAYLGGLPSELATPRRSSPRTHVPAGSVGIGGSQTGVYPMVSPGGWNLIGWTPLQLFDPERERASLLAAGDRVRFVPGGAP
jgi:inhibitor of KinA